MFGLDAFPDLLTVPWSRLEPGMIVIDGLRVNGILAPEFRYFEPLTSSAVNDIHDRYRLRSDRPMTVLFPGMAGLSAADCSEKMNSAEKKLKVFNDFRQGLSADYRKFGLPPRTALESKLVHPDSAIFPWGRSPGKRSLFNHIDRAVSLADVLTRTLSAEFDFPVDRSCRVHIVADLSFSMKASGRDEFITAALDVFHTRLENLLPLASFFFYAFSDDCREVIPPLTGKELPRRETSYEAFLRKVLRRADREKPDVVILLTDGLPGDPDLAERRFSRFASLGIDFIQCVFNIEGDKREVSEDIGTESLDGYITGSDADLRTLSDDEYAELMEQIREGHSKLARTAGGMQVMLNADEALSLVSVEAFDRWLGR